MKKIARKEMSAEKNGRKQTGGGPPPPKPSETTEWLNTIMGESISGLPAIYDSDALGGTANTSLNECNNLLNTEVLDDIETDADSKKVDITFDNSTPKALLRKPISKQLCKYQILAAVPHHTEGLEFNPNRGR
ncbi:unnamed protein product [Parnassius apollo]|uniref:(apollo) hypothetical protein n=1 Tax=Parnassius apollo TaxID=110799 RepID=A0A8S3XDA4_PARAO|nr:unnamed protein product [Parnassius apollo]